MAGQLPTELEQVLAAAGAQLLPRPTLCTRDDLLLPGRGRAVHIPGSRYLLAESFDDDPFRSCTAGAGSAPTCSPGFASCAAGPAS